MINLAIFASGNGSNAQRITEYFKDSDPVSIKIILTNNPEAFVIQRAAKLGIPSVIFGKKDLYETDNVLKILSEAKISYIILSGFLWKVPENLLREYSGKIINIHPALLPKYGGKGMYGMRVHEAVLKAGETESGITIHHVNEKYDEGQIIFQKKCIVDPDDTPETLAEKVHQLEYKYFPKVIESVILATPLP